MNETSQNLAEGKMFGEPAKHQASCLWCKAESDQRVVDQPPPTFVWSKMQTEAGQPLTAIVRRKETERNAGNGVFFWGVGNALGEPLHNLIKESKRPTVLFSIMRSPPRKVDVMPSAVAVWTRYLDGHGQSHPLPSHALVTSRATTPTGDKRRHYALVCHSESTLSTEELGVVNASHLWNLDAPTRVGPSQVTAVVEHGALYRNDGVDTGPVYALNMRARLKAPYFVRLSRPLILPDAVLQLLQKHQDISLPAAEWIYFVSQVMAEAEVYSKRYVSTDLFSATELSEDDGIRF